MDKLGNAMIYTLGPFTLDTRENLLCRGREPLTLGRRALVLLGALVNRPGALVSKEVLIESAWPGQAVEDSNLTVQIAALRRIFAEEPGGERWIETLPRRGYRFVGPVSLGNPDTAGATAKFDARPLALPVQPSIAVLPFQNMSSDAEQEYFADGMVEEITTALSRFRSLFVIARNSSFAFKGRSVDVKHIAQQLGVRYVLEGSVRKSANHVRITAQLIDAITGAHLWAEHFDSTLEDIFDLQDRVAARVVGEIAPRLNRIEFERASRKPTESLDAYDYYLRAAAHFIPTTKRDCDEMLRLAQKAIELDPRFAAAYAIAARSYVRRQSNNWSADCVQERVEAVRLARLAAELGQEDAFALAWAAYTIAFVGREPADGAALADRALELNPNLALAWAVSGRVSVMLGNPDVAVDCLERAMRLSPLDPLMRGFQSVAAEAYFLSGRYDEALSWAGKAMRSDPNWSTPWRIIVAAHALAGHVEQAKEACARLQQLDPLLRVGNFRDTSSPYQSADLAAYQDGLRKAGLPE